ncbi:hypothetical protein LK994_03090 [Ferruginibacter lapsinanis]|uniref:hypothetical protein n=1 Tax=Ferruginibacter lapsinanis TaxID=563172 RepID=UPI001E44D016|nr:hypothetical protein [Ferruginibacter lapsinanis]UEG50460.1 hypothetical protein LK994_03090 [Ferruginibacter lapsinanis]
MKNCFLLLLIICCLVACKRTNSKLKEQIIASDSVAINYFTGDGKMDTVTAVKIISDKKIIAQLVDMISAKKQSIVGKCGYDGSLHFFKNNVVIQDVDFRMNEANCMQFSFMQEGKLAATTLSPEARQLLENIRK